MSGASCRHTCQHTRPGVRCHVRACAGCFGAYAGSGTACRRGAVTSPKRRFLGPAGHSVLDRTPCRATITDSERIRASRCLTRSSPLPAHRRRGMHTTGGNTIPVGRPGFKPGGWRHASPGGFDSHFPPPSCLSMLCRCHLQAYPPNRCHGLPPAAHHVRSAHAALLDAARCAGSTADSAQTLSFHDRDRDRGLAGSLEFSVFAARHQPPAFAVCSRSEHAP